MANEERAILKIGHRGACGYEPENTLASFQKAIQLGADMIELDVRQCASGQLVVIHDEMVDRTTNGRGYVHLLSLDELKLLDAGNGEFIPTLKEALDLIDRRVVVNIELKGPGTENLVVDIVLDYIKNRSWNYADFLLSSFNHHRLAYIKKHIPDVNIGMLTWHVPLDYAAIKQQLDVYSLHVPQEIANQEFVDDVHSRGVKFFVFTANSSQEIKHLKSLGVDGIFSDYPDLL